MKIKKLLEKLNLDFEWHYYKYRLGKRKIVVNVKKRAKNNDV